MITNNSSAPCGRCYFWTSVDSIWLPFKPQCPHINSPYWSSYISLKNKLREFNNRSKHFLCSDHFINSHNPSLGNIWILLGEKLMLVTKRVKVAWVTYVKHKTISDFAGPDRSLLFCLQLRCEQTACLDSVITVWNKTMLVARVTEEWLYPVVEGRGFNVKGEGNNFFSNFVPFLAKLWNVK